MSPFYTKTGDDGTTGLLSEKRVDKFDLQIEVLGTLDELSAALGLARSLCSKEIDLEIKNIQRVIYEIMSEVAAIPENLNKFMKLDETTIEALETQIALYEQKTQLPSDFILPGDGYDSAAIAVARTITRRAERRLVELSRREDLLRPVLLRYINRLSSFLFILEIHVLQNQEGKLTLAKEKVK